MRRAFSPNPVPLCHTQPAASLWAGLLCGRAVGADARGSALIVVLAMVVLLTALVVAFFSSARLSQQISASSANQTKADLFAQGATDCIVSGFRQTIASGTLTVSGSEFPNLVALSGSGSEPLTTSPSANGRKVSLARWNLPRLLPAADADDLTPSLADSQAPRWINVTRDGGAGGEVFGRYAYMIYNEGGLLDANYAGSVTPSGTALTVWNRKGSMAFADLSKIGLSVSDAAQLVGWRNYASVQAGNALPNLSVDWSRYMNVALSGLTVSGSLFNNQSDQRFTSRQQLIKFFTNGVAQNAADRQRLQTALQYLGTFSVAPNQPSYQPAAGEPGVSGAVGQTVSSSVINAPFRSLTVSVPFTRNDGSVAVVGEPLVKTRFPLSYLLWLTYQGPSETAMSSGDLLFDEYVRRGMPRAEVERLRRMGTENNIRKYFGLVWSNGQWRYDTALLVGNSIAPLANISGREPNFFELLKAGIHTGAVAQLTKGNATDDFRRDLDSQIIQIGANIIDQSQPENFPTVIVLKNLAYWGVVDLPYLYGLATVSVLTEKGTSVPALTGSEPKVGAVIVNAGKVALLDVPVIWNPHQANTNADSQPNGAVHPQLSPRYLRIVISNKSMLNTTEAGTSVYASFNVDNDYRASGSEGRYDLSGRRPLKPYAKGERNETLGYVDMSNNDNALEFTGNTALYREPTPLLLPNIADSGLKAASSDGKVTEISGKEYVGFRLDTVNSLYSLAVNGTNFVAAVNYIFGQSGNLFTVSLEYRDANDNWRPYRQVSLGKPGNQRATGVAYDYDAGEDAKISTGNPIAGDPYRQSLLKVWRGSNTSLGFTRSKTVAWAGKNWTVNYPRDATLTVDPRLNWSLDHGFGENQGSVGQWLDLNQPAEIKTMWPAQDGASYASADMFHGYYHGNLSTNMQTAPPKPVGYYCRSGEAGTDSKGYYKDADGVVRRPAGAFSTGNTIGMPLASVKGYSGQTSNRPVMLQRPYRSVAELGYVFANLPWKHLSMVTPESGFNPLLDVFSVSDRDGSLSAGRVDLNTRQAPVLQAILSGAYRDELALSTNTTDALTVSEAETIAGALLEHTARKPLENVADLVGRYDTADAQDLGYERPLPYNGFSAKLPQLYGGTGAAGDKNKKILRFMESTIRTLSDSGQAGTLNLLIDVIAQTGRDADGQNFFVEAERRYWVHVAIDRQTGKIIGRQIEEVDE